MPLTEDQIIENINSRMRSRDSSGVARGIEGNKDQAAQSLGLAKDSGQDAGSIYSQFDNYYKKSKTETAQGIVEQEPWLRQYVRENPLGATVSQDDWGALSEYTQKVRDFNKQYTYPFGSLPMMLHRMIPEIIDTVKSSIQEAGEAAVRVTAPPGEMLPKIEEAKKGQESLDKMMKIPGWTPELQKKLEDHAAKAYSHPELGYLAQVFYGIVSAPVTAAIRSEISAPLEEHYEIPKEITEGALLMLMMPFAIKGAHQQVVASGEAAARLARTKQLRQVLDKATRTFENLESWSKAGQHPPIGVDPAIDQLIGVDSINRHTVLDALMDQRTKTETMDLSPEAWQELNKIVFRDGPPSIYLPWDVAQKLYGGKVPEPGDKMLGDVSRIYEQWKQSEQTTEPIEIPMSELAAMDKELYKQLADDLFFEGGMNRRRAQELIKGEPEISTIHEQEIPGLSEEMRRPFTLEHKGEGLHDVINEHGEKTGQIRVTEQEGGKNLFLSWEKGQYDPAGIITMLNHLKERFPDAETISTVRLPGMNSLERALQGSDIAVDMPFRIKERPVDLVRKSAGLRPLFDLTREGPRKYTMVRGEAPDMYMGYGKDAWTIVDEGGRPVASLEITPKKGGKEAYIGWVGDAKVSELERHPHLGPEDIITELINRVGPAAVRDLIRQIQENYPEATHWGGTRVTGSRRKAATEAAKKEHEWTGAYTVWGGERISRPFKKLLDELENMPPGWEPTKPLGPEHEKFMQLLSEGFYHQGQGLFVKRAGDTWTLKELQLEQRIEQFLNKIVGKGRVDVEGYREMRAIRGKRGVRELGGVFRFDPEGGRGFVGFSLSAEHPFASAGHEAIHFLRNHGIITEGEWEVLRKAAIEEGWTETEAMKRYEHLREAEPELFVEEAIADKFKEWAKQSEEQQKAHPMARVFYKIKELVDQLKSIYRETMGREPTAENIFRDIQIGRMSRREMKATTPERLAQLDKYDIADEKPTREYIEDPRTPTFAPGAIMDKKKYAQYQRHMAEQNADDIRIERDKALREVKQRSAPEWKARREDMKQQVGQELAQRPDFRARAFFQNGQFYGQDTHYMPKVDPRYLTKEQKAEFPARWQERKGLNPDDLAQPLGYQTGAQLVDAMIQFERNKGSLSPRDFLERTINKETDRRMEQKYGDRAKQDLEEANEQALGHSQMEILTEEATALAMRAGMKLSLSKDDVKAMAANAFLGSPQTKASHKYYFQEMYRTGKAAEHAFMVGDYIGAFQNKWMQVHLFEMARQVKRLEQERGQLERVANRFHTRYPENFPAEFTEWIQHLLVKGGYQVDRGPGDLERMMATRDHGGDLKKFVEDLNELPDGYLESYDTALNPYLIIPDFILDNPGWSKPVKSMTVGELKAFNSAIQSLQRIGAHQNKLLALGEEADLQRMLTIAKDELKAIGPEKEPRAPGKKAKLHQWYHVGTLAPEDLMIRLDKGNEHGFFTKYITDPMNDAAYGFDRMHKEFRQKVIDIDKKFGKTTARPINNDVFHHPKYLEKDPTTGKFAPRPGSKSLMSLTHEHLRKLLLDWGNKSNRERITEGFHVTEADVEKLLAREATKEDWQWAQARGHLYYDLQKHADEVTMRESNTMVEMLPLPDIDTPHGKMAGWYFPIIYDRAMDGGAKNTLKNSPPRHVRTYRGWERKRIGPAGPIDLSLNLVDMDMNRRIHDINYREVLRDFRKIKDDPGLRSALERFMGRHYVDMLDRLHDDVAMPYRPNTGALQAANRYSEMARANTIMLLVGLKAGTFIKHVGSTAVQSWARAGVFKSDFYASANELMPYHPKFAENWGFIINGGKVGNLETTGSREIQKRWRHYAEVHGVDTLALRALKGREFMQKLFSAPIAAGDALSSVILWNAVYKKARAQYMTEGLTIEQAHVKADTRADFAVRQTHGSTSIMRRPELMRRTDPMARWFTSLFTYYNHVYGQTYRMMWRSKDLVTERQRGDIPTQSIPQYASEITSLAMAYHILPAAFYWLAQDFLLGKEDDEEESLAMKMAGPLLHNAGGMLLGVRDVMGFLSGGGQQPTPGIIGQPLQQMWNLAREFNPDKDWTEKDPGKVIRYGNNVIGLTTGYSSDQVGMWLQFLYNYMQAVEEPESGADVYRGIRRGTIERRKR